MQSMFVPLITQAVMTCRNLKFQILILTKHRVTSQPTAGFNIYNQHYLEPETAEVFIYVTHKEK